jgi:hypothetical protein
MRHRSPSKPVDAEVFPVVTGIDVGSSPQVLEFAWDILGFGIRQDIRKKSRLRVEVLWLDFLRLFFPAEEVTVFFFLLFEPEWAEDNGTSKRAHRGP